MLLVGLTRNKIQKLHCGERAVPFAPNLQKNLSPTYIQTDGKLIFQTSFDFVLAIGVVHQSFVHHLVIFETINQHLVRQHT
jgi:hypothetical protein